MFNERINFDTPSQVNPRYASERISTVSPVAPEDAKDVSDRILPATSKVCHLSRSVTLPPEE